MAIIAANYANTSFWEIHGIQKVYIEDYNGLKAELEVLETELTAASELFKSGQTASVPARRKVERLIRRKLELQDIKDRVLEDINALGRILDERDGTIAAGQAAA